MNSAIHTPDIALNLAYLTHYAETIQSFLIRCYVLYKSLRLFSDLFSAWIVAKWPFIARATVRQGLLSYLIEGVADKN